MKITLADIEFAKAQAYIRRWPSLDKMRLGQMSSFDRRMHERYTKKPFANIHACVNAHARSKESRSRYMHSNTLWIIASRVARSEEWKTHASWGNDTGAGSKEHWIIVSRILRKLRRTQCG